MRVLGRTVGRLGGVFNTSSIRLIGLISPNTQECLPVRWGLRTLGTGSSSIGGGNVGGGAAADDAFGLQEGDEGDNGADEHSVAVGVQCLLRSGYKQLDPAPLVEAAERVGRLPSGSVTRRYLSAFIMNANANLLRHRHGDHDPAESKLLFEGALEHAVEEASQGLGDDRCSDIVSFASDLAINHAANGDLEGAEKLLKRANYWIGNSRVGPDGALMTATLSNLGLVQFMMGKFSNAHDNLERAVESDCGDDPVVSAAALTGLSASLRHQGILDRGQALALDALERSHEAWAVARRLSEPHSAPSDKEGQREEEPVSDLAAASQASLVRSAALTNACLYKLHPSNNNQAPSAQTVAEVFALASEAMALKNEFVDSVPALLLQGLSAPDIAQAADFYKLAASSVLVHSKARKQTSSMTLESSLTAVRDNLVTLLGVAQTELDLLNQSPAEAGKPDPLRGEAEINAAARFSEHITIKKLLDNIASSEPMAEASMQANMLRKVALGPDESGSSLWVQEQAPFVTGITLRSFINSVAPVEHFDEDEIV